MLFYHVFHCLTLPYGFAAVAVGGAPPASQLCELQDIVGVWSKGFCDTGCGSAGEAEQDTGLQTDLSLRICTLRCETKMCPLLNRAFEMLYAVFICNKGFYCVNFIKKFVLTFSSHMRYKGFVQLIPLSFLSCLLSPS